MGFRTNVSNDMAVISLEDCGDGEVFVQVGEDAVFHFSDDGTIELCEYVQQENVGNLKLTDGKDDGWGTKNNRARVFFNGEELLLPSEIKAAEKKAASKAKKAA